LDNGPALKGRTERPGTNRPSLDSQLAELLAMREVSDELSAIVESVLAQARVLSGPRRSKTMWVFELMADRLRADAHMLHEAIEQIDALRGEVRGLRTEMLEGRQDGHPTEKYWLKSITG
jgi:hypothetical protein